MDRFLNSYANNPLENLASAPFLVDFIVSSLIVVLLTLFIAIKINRPTTWVYYGVTDIIFIVAFLFGIPVVHLLVVLVVVAVDKILDFIEKSHCF